MLTPDKMRSLRNAQPFIPFRLHLNNGSSVEVRSPEHVLVLRHYAVVALPDPQATDGSWDQCVTVWYAYVTRVEMLSPAPA
jgi:hypothetical protein